MRIREIHIVEGLFERKIDFINQVNLIFSKDNSRGKTTLVRLILYSLGYQIPNTKNIQFEKCSVKCTLELDNGDVIRLHRPNCFSISVVGDDKAFALPEQLDELHEMLFGTNNKDILHNLLGSFYFDQEKGWTLLNRGVVIGSVHFNIENLVRGVSGVDCSELIRRERQVDSDYSKYKQMYSIAQYRDSVRQDSLITETYEEETDAELQQLLIKKSNLQREISRVGQSISGNKKFRDFVDEMKLLVQTDDGKQITVTRDNIVGLNDSVDYLIAKKKILMQELSDVLKKIDTISSQLANENQQLAFFKSESLAEVFDKQIVKLPMNQLAIKRAMDELEKKRKQLRDEISKISKSDSSVVMSLYKTVVAYATELGVGDSESVTSKYLFTSNLKELSGAVLHKLIFAFKLGYITEIENHLGIKLPIILDSPRGKEVDEKNISLMMGILKRDFKENQIIIASIYEYDFDVVKKIEIKDRLINEVHDPKK